MSTRTNKAAERAAARQAAIIALVDAAPPLTSRQIVALRALLGPIVPGSGRRSA